MSFRPLSAACAVMSTMQDRYRYVTAAAFRARGVLNAARANGAPPDELQALEQRANAIAGAVPLVREELRRVSVGFAWVLTKCPAANDERFVPPQDAD